MLAPINIRYSFRPVTRSLATGEVSDLFGLADEEPEHVVADQMSLDIRDGDLVLFTGPSGSGKSSLLRAAGRQLGAVDAMALELPDRPLIDALPGSVNDRLNLLAACGLSEARLLLRAPSELSDGQRYRFRIAVALAHPASFLMADEFAAYLERTLAKVLAFNLRRLGARTKKGILLATTHEDLTPDLRPDLWLRCRGDGATTCERNSVVPGPISFANELKMSDGTKGDWEHFAKWHYRSHQVACVKRVVLLRHRDEPIGICVFTTPAASLSLRTAYFGLSGARTRLGLQALNRQLWLLSRVVLHPTYRGAGIGASFVRQACATCEVDWIETLSAMGHANPFFEKACFQRVGVIRKPATQQPRRYRGMYGKRGVGVSKETEQKSRYSEPVYYVFDNRGRGSDQFEADRRQCSIQNHSGGVASNLE